MFAYEFSKSVLCYVQHISDWLVRVERADGTILFSQHDLRLQAAVFALAESVMELCALLHREVVTRSYPSSSIGDPLTRHISASYPKATVVRVSEGAVQTEIESWYGIFRAGSLWP